MSKVSTVTEGARTVAYIGKERVGVASAGQRVERFLNAGKRPKTNIAKNITNPYVMGFLDDYLAGDLAQAKGQWLAGEIYWLYFRAPRATQDDFVAALCKRHRTPLPSPDLSPRQRLIIACYGHDPKAMLRSGIGDTKAGKRINWAIREFEERTGIRRKKRKTRASETFPRLTGKFVDKLRSIAKSEELTILNRLIARAFGKSAVLVTVAA